MYVIKNSKELEGKKLVFVDLEIDGNIMVFVTKDKGVFLVDYEDTEICPFTIHQTQNFMIKKSSENEEIRKLELFTEEEVETYRKEKEEREKKRAEENKARNEAYNYREYLRLKEMFKDKDKN